jgi:hypothetical protein
MATSWDFPRPKPGTFSWPFTKDTAAVERALRQQLTYWHELLVVDVDPETTKPYAVLRFTKITPKVLRTFAAELVLAAVGLGGLVILAILTTQVQGLPGWKTFAAVVGVLGISIGGVQTSLKNATQSLIGRLHADLYSDLVTTAISSLRSLGKGGEGGGTKGGPGSDRDCRTAGQ